MPISEYPKLRDDVKLQHFDTATEGNSPFYLVVHPNGQHWQIPTPFYAFLSLLDGTRTIPELQQEIDRNNYEGISGCEVGEVLEKLVIARNLLKPVETELKESGKIIRQRPWNLFLAIPLINSDRLDAITRFLQKIFNYKVAIFILIAGVGIQLASWFSLKSNWSLTQFLSSKSAVFGFVIILLVSTPIHELGHLSACRRFGSAAGEIGFGLYVIFPVMYIDVSPAWALPRMQRVIVDSGGMYFQFIGATVLSAIHLITGNAVFRVLGVVYLVGVLVNLFPLLKLDGYWCLSDCLGVPNLYRAARETLWQELARIRGRQGLLSPSLYLGWRKDFLMVFGIFYLSFWGILGLLLIRSLPGAFATLTPHNLNSFFANLTASPFSQIWWKNIPLQSRQLVSSLFLLIMICYIALQAIRRLSNTIKRKPFTG